MEKNKQNYFLIITQNPLYLFHWTFSRYSFSCVRISKSIVSDHDSCCLFFPNNCNFSFTLSFPGQLATFSTRFFSSSQKKMTFLVRWPFPWERWRTPKVLWNAKSYNPTRNAPNPRVNLLISAIYQNIGLPVTDYPCYLICLTRPMTSDRNQHFSALRNEWPLLSLRGDPRT